MTMKSYTSNALKLFGGARVRDVALIAIGASLELSVFVERPGKLTVYPSTNFFLLDCVNYRRYHMLIP
jgi:hypothetical protein